MYFPANLNWNNLSDEQILMDNILDSFNSYWDVNQHPLWRLYYSGVFRWGKAFIFLNKSFDIFIHQVLIEHCCSQALFWALEIHWSTKQRFCPCRDALVMLWNVRFISTVSPLYLQAIQLWIQPTGDRKYWGKKNSRKFQKAKLDLPCWKLFA